MLLRTLLPYRHKETTSVLFPLGVERTFVDDPWASLEEADRVVADILAECNFPTDSRQEASKGVGVMHPQVGRPGLGGQGLPAPGACERSSGVPPGSYK